MSVETVRKYLSSFGHGDGIMEFDVSSATVELAAAALGTEGRRIAKSISLKQGDKAVIIVASGDARIDNRKYKDRFSQKAKMLSHDEVEELTGHAVGGVCPFAVKDGVDVYLDESLKRFDTVYPACGSTNSAIELSVQELERISDHFCGWVDVTTIPQEDA